jgi:hypothetical protein
MSIPILSRLDIEHAGWNYDELMASKASDHDALTAAHALAAANITASAQAARRLVRELNNSQTD